MSSIKKIWKLLDSRNKFYLFFIISLMAIAMCFEVLSVAIVIPVISILIEPSNFEYSYLPNELISFLNNKDTTAIILITIILLILIFFLKNIFILFMQWRLSKYIFGLQESISKSLYDTYVNKNYDFFIKKNTSELIRNIITEITQFTNGALLPSLILISELFVLLGIVIFILYISFASALISFTIFFTFFFLYYFFVRNYLLKIGVERISKEEGRMKILNQGFGAIKEIKIYNKENFLSEEFAKLTKFIVFAGQRNYFFQTVPRQLFEFLAIVTLSVVIYVLLFVLDDRQNLIPILGLYAASAFRLIPSMNKILNSLQSIRYAFASTEVLYNDLQKKINYDFYDTKYENQNQFNNWQKVSFENVSYSYPLTEKNVLHEVNLHIEKGQSIGIIGETGSGKSTLINLISLLLRPSSGSIKVDNKIICSNNFHQRKVTHSWQSKIGYVPQQIYLNDDSILKNIAFGIDQEIISLDRIKEVINLCQLSDLISSLPDGIHTKVGEKGIRISGGQMQRIGIARALYNDPDLLILDEATSALDEATEKNFIDSLFSIKRDKTLLIVTHKPNLLNDCDEVYKLENKILKKINHE